MPEHLLATHIHRGRYIQTADPGAVGAGVEWLDTNTTPAVHKKRNTGNTDWDVILDPSDYATQTDVTDAVDALVASAPGALDTLNELAAALGDDENFATTVTNALALKAPLASPALTGTPTAPTAAPGTNSTQVATTAYVDTPEQWAALSDGATVTWDVDGLREAKAKVTLGGDRTLDIDNAVDGSAGILIVTQGTGGGHSLTLPAGSVIMGGGGTAPTLSGDEDDVDILAFEYDGSVYYWTVGLAFA